MNTSDRKLHWEKIYETKAITEVSWYQPVPLMSLSLIEKSKVPRNVKIIDVGGGDSFLVDHLLDLGYSNITVLDISAAAIGRAKERLGSRAELVKWIVADVTTFQTTEKYDIWHDRAAFHFLKSDEDISAYVNNASSFTSKDAHLIVGTFSVDGPLKCSGIEITQYSGSSMKNVFNNDWFQSETLNVVHATPFNTEQAFVFGLFSKKH